MSDFSHYRDFIGSQPGKFFKDTLYSGTFMMVGINCLDPGQNQPVHDHATADKVYFVMEGSGLFTVGEEAAEAQAGGVIWAAAGVPHGVENRGTERLVLLVCIAPPPGT